MDFKGMTPEQAANAIMLRFWLLHAANTEKELVDSVKYQVCAGIKELIKKACQHFQDEAVKALANDTSWAETQLYQDLKTEVSQNNRRLLELEKQVKSLQDIIINKSWDWRHETFYDFPKYYR